MAVDHILIAGELGCVVATHGLVVVGWSGALKFGYVKHTVVGCGVGKDGAVGVGEGEGLGACHELVDKRLAREIALVDREEVGAHHYAYRGHGHGHG